MMTLPLMVAGNWWRPGHGRRVARAAEPRLHELRHVGEGGVAHHHRVQTLARAVEHQVHEGHEVALENLLPRVRDDGQAAVRIHRRAAEAGEVFAAADDVSALQAVEVCAREAARPCSGSSPKVRAAQAVVVVVAAEVEHGREVDVEAEQAEGARGERAELLGEVGAAGVAHGLGRGRRLADVAEAVNEAALLIDADEDAALAASRICALRSATCAGRLDVAAEEDDAARPHSLQHLAPVGWSSRVTASPTKSSRPAFCSSDSAVRARLFVRRHQYSTRARPGARAPDGLCVFKLARRECVNCSTAGAGRARGVRATLGARAALLYFSRQVRPQIRDEHDSEQSDARPRTLASRTDERR